MVTKSKKESARKSLVKVGKLKLNRETVQNLAGSELKKVKGGVAEKPVPNPPPITVVFGTCAGGWGCPGTGWDCR